MGMDTDDTGTISLTEILKWWGNAKDPKAHDLKAPEIALGALGNRCTILSLLTSVGVFNGAVERVSADRQGWQRLGRDEDPHVGPRCHALQDPGQAL